MRYICEHCWTQVKNWKWIQRPWNLRLSHQKYKNLISVVNPRVPAEAERKEKTWTLNKTKPITAPVINKMTQSHWQSTTHETNTKQTPPSLPQNTKHSTNKGTKCTNNTCWPTFWSVMSLSHCLIPSPVCGFPCSSPALPVTHTEPIKWNWE